MAHDDRLTITLGIFFVWSLWLIVTLVYAEVILGIFQNSFLIQFSLNQFFDFFDFLILFSE
jgi:hypothetical protein